MNTDRKIGNILALDCAITEGSIALFRAGDLVRTVPAGSPSRAEEVLRIIEQYLRSAELAAADLDAIAIAVGPGSYSGIRIGMATAMGLAGALQIPCFGVSSLEAMAYGSQSSSSTILTAVPVGKKQIAWQVFGQAETTPQLAGEQTFIDALTASATSILFAHHEVLNRIGDKFPPGVEVVDAGVDVARYVATYAMTRPARETGLRPIYLRDGDIEGRASSV